MNPVLLATLIVLATAGAAGIVTASFQHLGGPVAATGFAVLCMFLLALDFATSRKRSDAASSDEGK